MHEATTQEPRGILIVLHWKIPARGRLYFWIEDLLLVARKSVKVDRDLLEVQSAHLLRNARILGNSFVSFALCPLTNESAKWVSSFVDYTFTE